MQFLWIGLGGFLGANARFLVTRLAARQFGTTFPYGTFIVNVVGSFVIGFFLALSLEKVAIRPEWRLLFAVGFLGSFTTFSTFAYESFGLIEQGSWLAAIANVGGETVLGVVAAAAGIILARFLIQ